MNDPFATINLDTLESVSGGRYTAGSEIKPELIQAIGELAKAVTGIGQTKQASQEKSMAQMMQMIQQRMGGGK